MSGSISITFFYLSTFFLVGYFALFLCRGIELSWVSYLYCFLFIHAPLACSVCLIRFNVAKLVISNWGGDFLMLFFLNDYYFFYCCPVNNCSPLHCFIIQCFTAFQATFCLYTLPRTSSSLSFRVCTRLPTSQAMCIALQARLIKMVFLYFVGKV